MTFHLKHAKESAGAMPFLIVDETGREVEWATRFLDVQRVSGKGSLTLRSYGYQLLHFIRWWSRQPGVDAHRLEASQFTESTLIDYVRAQLQEQPKPSPENINARSSMLRRLFRFFFQENMPHSPYLLHRDYWRQSPWGYGRRRPATTVDLKQKVPQRVVVPLSVHQVERFWSSFRSTRDLAIVALMLLNGLRSREVLALKLGDLDFRESLVRVRGKGQKARVLPLPPETIQLVQCYLQTERPLTTAPEVFVSLKGKARGSAMTPAGLRSLFRHHRNETAVAEANPHRFRHTFAGDMIRAGVSLPTLMRLMGHAHIHTTLLYIHLTAQDVFDEYARAVTKLVAERRAIL
jgi:site-specific recombinase XerD